MVNRTVLYKKISHILYNLGRLKEKHYISEEEFFSNADVREVVLFNFQQAIQGCIHIGAHIISDEGWGVPGSISEIFYKLEEHNIIPSSLVEALIPMAGFRKLIVHQYKDIDYKIVFELYQNRIGYIEEFLNTIQAHFPP